MRERQREMVMEGQAVVYHYISFQRFHSPKNLLSSVPIRQAGMESDKQRQKNYEKTIDAAITVFNQVLVCLQAKV